MFVQAKILERGDVPTRNKFQKHFHVLAWKSYLQRQRRWRILVLETVFASVLFLSAVFIAKPVFLTPLEDEPEPPTSLQELLKSLKEDIIVGFAPMKSPYMDIMLRAAEILGIEVIAGDTEKQLNEHLHRRTQGKLVVHQVSWVLWEETEINNVVKFRIRSTETTAIDSNNGSTHLARNHYMQNGFLAIETAVSHALLEFITGSENPPYELNLVSMPVTPLMDESAVERVTSMILMCFTVALLPPVVETEALVVTETANRFKLAMRHRGVDYSAMYLAWIVYALLTALPICLLGSITLILIFRWIHLMNAMLMLVSYFVVMMMIALIMSLIHNRAIITCTWTILQTMLQTFLAELMVHHGYEKSFSYMALVIHTFLPPLGLLNGLHQFALLQTGNESNQSNSVKYMLLLWLLLIIIYFLLLMLLQRTISRNAIGGQVSWKAIIFKQAVDNSELRPVKQPTDTKGKLQEVDDLVAKAISFRDVTKSIMGTLQLSHVSFDIYRGEYTMIFSERIQEKMMTCIEDMLTGLTFADYGTINVLGVQLNPNRNLLNEPTMMGYFDRSSILIPDLTVEEHFSLFAEMSLWNESSESVLEYIMVRTKRLKTECDLHGLEDERIRRLGMYYRAQLCWALATLLEPRVLILSDFMDDAVFMAVLRDKIVQHQKHLTVVKITLSSIKLEEADRVFLMDNRVLAFGGTPAFMFFKYGRDYRIRINFRIDAEDDESSRQLMKHAHKYGAVVRAHVGSLLILRIPLEPSSQVAKLLEEIEGHKETYKIMSMNVSLADPEEVFRRSIHESRVSENIELPEAHHRSRMALAKLNGPTPWKRHLSFWSTFTQLRIVGWKYFAFYIHYRFLLIITLLATMIAGLCMGYSLGKTLKRTTVERDLYNAKELTVEALPIEMNTTLVIRLDESELAKSVANAYVFSLSNASQAEVDRITYTALPRSESLTEYLVTRAIDSPLHYANMHAYGIDVYTKNGDIIVVNVLYSPLHADKAAAARSLARAYLALLRHYTGHIDAYMQITEDPLVLDMWKKESSEPPLLIQFLLVLTISHMVMVPSNEYGLVRFMQSNAMNFSPARYWLLLAFCDLILYWFLVLVMASLSCVVLYIMLGHLNFVELVAVPFMLMVYGVGCVPQAYLFSLGPQGSLNSMGLVIVNIVLGETTLITRLLYGEVENFALDLMSLSPQFNMAYALVKIREIFLYNNECKYFIENNMCHNKSLHMCCEKCGVLQHCFSKKSFLENIGREILMTLVTSVLFMGVLLMWEYRVISYVWNVTIRSLLYKKGVSSRPEEFHGSALREKIKVIKKHEQYKRKPMKSDDRDYLMAVNVSRVENGLYYVHNVYLGIRKGEALALSGLKRHGRLALCEVLAGYKSATQGHLWALGKYTQRYSPHKYATKVTLCMDRNPLPTWMTVYDALEMMAVLRGVPKKHIPAEITNYINALDLNNHQDLLICRLDGSERRRLDFAASVVGAPHILIVDECTAYQSFLVKRAMFHILNLLKRRGHAIVHSAVSVENHMPVSNRLAIMRDGELLEIDNVDKLLERYSLKGFTVVVHLKDEVDVERMFLQYFDNVVINDTTDVLVNVQVSDSDLTWTLMFKKMQQLKEDNEQVYAYVVCAKTIDYIYHCLLSDEHGSMVADDLHIMPWLHRFLHSKNIELTPSTDKLLALKKFKKKYGINSLEELPWTVIFQR